LRRMRLHRLTVYAPCRNPSSPRILLRSCKPSEQIQRQRAKVVKVGRVTFQPLRTFVFVHICVLHTVAAVFGLFLSCESYACFENRCVPKSTRPSSHYPSSRHRQYQGLSTCASKEEKNCFNTGIIRFMNASTKTKSYCIQTEQIFDSDHSHFRSPCTGR
jgi:hypothetical protein